MSSEEYRQQTGYDGPMIHPDQIKKANRVSNSKHSESRRTSSSQTLKTTYQLTTLRDDRREKTRLAWQNGSRKRRQKSPYTKLRERLYIRAESKCEDCGISEQEHLILVGRSLEMHHLSYEKSVPSLEEVRLLCRNCHGKYAGTFRGNRHVQVMKGVTYLLQMLDIELEDENFLETPRRVATYLLEHFRDEEELLSEIWEMRGAVFPSEYDGMITIQSIKTRGICPHHLMPVIYEVSLGYIPTGVTIGLSKLPRIAQLVCTLPLLQETVTSRLSNILQKVLSTQHVAVVLKGEHTCMTLRGVKSHDSLTVTSCMSGYFDLNDHGAKSEFYQSIRQGGKNG